MTCAKSALELLHKSFFNPYFNPNSDLNMLRKTLLFSTFCSLFAISLAAQNIKPASGRPSPVPTDNPAAGSEKDLTALNRINFLLPQLQTAMEQQNSALLDVIRPDLLTIMSEESAKADGATAAAMTQIQAQFAGFRLIAGDTNAGEAMLQQVKRFRDLMSGSAGK